MKVYACQKCGQLLHFENSTCLNCGTRLGYIPDMAMLSACDVGPDGALVALADPDRRWNPCANVDTAFCNWLVDVNSEHGFCEACDLNRTIPDLTIASNQERWRAIEAAKRRLIYALTRFGLPLKSRHEDQERGLAFDFLADQPNSPVMTGHDDGLITINIAEADTAELERRRIELGEPYRTILGHMRHEVGHYYWDLLVRDGGKLDAARDVFGDERASYADALQHHYENGAPSDWEDAYVSAYATMHPWEDFAETWTHYLHMVDTLDTAHNFGMHIDPLVTARVDLNADVEFDPYKMQNFDRLVTAWIPLTVAVNSLNRSMGQRDLYPFALSRPAIAKLGFIHDLVRGAV
jgi:hypothetical protein